MYRLIESDLEKWVKSSARTPLLLRGARQIGKTYIIKKLAETQFENLVEINFELEPSFKGFFQSLKPKNITTLISDTTRQKIVPGETLLFLDEIQMCPEAIMSLRYFKEQMPELHVIGAGSLLEFTINQANFSMPVGRIQYMYMQPLSFKEYLIALKYEGLLTQINQASIDEPIDNNLHNALLRLVKEYLLIGGMPETIQTYLNTGDFQESQYKQTNILNTYRDDFGKYAKQTDHKYLQKVFERTPALLGQQIKYNKIEESMRSRDLKEAISLLNSAGVVRTINATSASGLPLHALVNEKKFKLLYLDVGLASRATQVGLSEVLNSNINLIHQGAISEQFVGQELLAYQDCRLEPQLNFWCRDEKGSQAEVDYIVSYENKIIPIEVKSGKTGTLKSIHMLMKERKFPFGLRISEMPISFDNHILSVPFYLISELPRLIDFYL